MSVYVTGFFNAVIHYFNQSYNGAGINYGRGDYRIHGEGYTAARNYSYMISNDAGHNQVFITENDCPGIDHENHR